MVIRSAVEVWQQCLVNADSQTSSYGRTVRVKLDEQDCRIFESTSHGTSTWRSNFNTRSLLERIFSGFDQGYRFEHYCMHGNAKKKAHAVLAIALMMAIALGNVRARRQWHVSSMVKPVAVLDCG